MIETKTDIATLAILGLLIAGMLCIASLSGCTVKPLTDPLPSTQPQRDAISQQAETIGDTSTDIRAHAQETKTQADAWQAVAPSPQHHAEVLRLQSEIAALTMRQRDAAIALRETREQLDTAAAASDARVAALTKQVDELQDAVAARARWLWHLVQIAGVVALAGGAVVAGMVAPRLGGAVAIGGVVLIGVGTFMLSSAATWIPWIVLAALVLAIGGVGYVMYDKYRRDGFDVERLAELWQETKEDAGPKTKEFIAALRRDWKELDKAIEGLKS